MQLNGSHLIRADRDAVWAALQDPAVLVTAIPGCLELAEDGADRYRARVRAGVASITGVYDGTVALTGQDAPRSYTLEATGQGGPGTIDATAEVRLREADEGTFVEYDAEAVVGGAIAGVGQRVLAGVAKRNAAQFFTAVDHHLMGGPVTEEEPAPAPGAPTAVPAAASGGAGGGTSATGEAATAPQARVFRRPAAPAAAPGADARTLLGAALVGAAIALIGVLVGRSTVRPVERVGGSALSWHVLSPRVSVRSGPLGT